MNRDHYQWVTRVWVGLVVVVCTLAGGMVRGESFDEALVEPMVVNDELAGRYARGLGDYHLAYLLGSEGTKEKEEVRQERAVVELRMQFDDYIKRARQASGSNQVLANRLQGLGLEKLEAVMGGYRGLIDGFEKSPRRPIWLTSLAELNLQQWLQIRHGFAAEAVRFGVPTREQEVAYADAVREAFYLLAEADAGLYKMQTRLPRSSEYKVLKMQGLPEVLFDDYGARRVPYYLGVAAISAATLPADDAYFTGEFDRTNSLLIRKKTVESERKRLLDLGLRRLDGFITDQGDIAGVRFSALVHASYALNVLGEHGRSMKLLQPLIRSQRRDLTTFRGQLLHAHAMSANDVGAGLGELKRVLQNHPVVKQSLIFRMMCVDAMFRVQLENLGQLQSGQGRGAALNKAFEVYYGMLDDGSLEEGERKQLSFMVAKRFERLMDYVDDVNDVPAGLRLLMTDYGLQQMKAAIDRGEENVQGSDLNHYDQMIQMLAETLDKQEVDAQSRSRGLYNAAIAMYLLDEVSMENLQEVAGRLVDVAKRFPQQPVSIKAITFATQTLQGLHQKYPNIDGIAEGYEAAAEVLFNAFSVSEAADNQRVYYAFYFLQGKGRFADAAVFYKLVPFDHVQYYDAQRELLFCYDAQVFGGRGDDDGKQVEVLIEALNVDAKRIEREAKREDEGEGERYEKAQMARAASVMLRAAVLELQGAYADAMALLEEDGVDFDAYPNLLPRVLQVKIASLIGTQQMSEAARLAEQFMAAKPGLAAATIDQLMKQIDERFDVVLDPLSDLLPHDRMKKEAQAVLTLAETFRVANDGGLIKPGLDDEYLTSMDIIASRAYRVMGEAQKAVDLLGPRTVEFGDVLELILAYGDANFDLGTSESLERARIQYRMVMGSYQELPYPEVYYHAWLNYLKACVAGGVFVEDVPLYVGQLRMRDPEMGGAGYKAAFGRLVEQLEQ